MKYLADLVKRGIVFQPIMTAEIELPNVKISKDAPIALIGDSFVEGITLRSGKTESVDGVFCLRNAIAPSKLASFFEIENGHILVDRFQQTNVVAGCFIQETAQAGHTIVYEGCRRRKCVKDIRV